MQVPVQIDFRGSDPIPRMREQIVAKLRGLDEAFGRIVAARVVITVPGGRHKSGAQYGVAIHLTLPGGRLVEVERTPPLDERFADPTFAMNDAFRRARRQLQDEARRLDGRVKAHEPRPSGEIVELDPERNFGFLLSSDGAEVYFHRNSMIGAKFESLSVGSKVAFVEEQGDKGPQASTLWLLEEGN